MAEVEHSGWPDHALAVLREAGLKSGQGRRAVVELLDRQPCALTAREIDDALRAEGRAVGLATVYRNLELLVEHRLVGKLDVGQGTARYERLLPTGEHHHHLVCDRCGKVIPFDDPQLERTIERITDKIEFRVDEHDVVLHGACSTCET
jgi:Fur family ferric uptake transcriptional regulator